MNSFKQQPLIAEVLPGFTTLAILVSAYFLQNPNLFHQVVTAPSATTYITASGFAAILSAWIIGTFLDSLRDIAETLLDLRWPVNWDYLLKASSESIQKLDDSWLAYYFLNGNYVFGILMTFIFAYFAGIGIPTFWLVCMCFALAVFIINFITLRQELRRLMAESPSIEKLPHEGVYARLGVSQAKPSKDFPEGKPGVGVFAVMDIKQGADIFGDDDEPTVTVSRSVVEKLPESLRKLYQDFAVLRGDRYICPTSFNKLTPSWYPNDSDQPNIGPDKDLRFRALRDIKAGDELTAHYEDYSENEKVCSASDPPSI